MAKVSRRGFFGRAVGGFAAALGLGKLTRWEGFIPATNSDNEPWTVTIGPFTTEVSPASRARLQRPYESMLAEAKHRFRESLRYGSAQDITEASEGLACFKVRS